MGKAVLQAPWSGYGEPVQPVVAKQSSHIRSRAVGGHRRYQGRAIVNRYCYGSVELVFIGCPACDRIASRVLDKTHEARGRGALSKIKHARISGRVQRS